MVQKSEIHTQGVIWVRVLVLSRQISIQRTPKLVLLFKALLGYFIMEVIHICMYLQKCLNVSLCTLKLINMTKLGFLLTNPFGCYRMHQKLCCTYYKLQKPFVFCNKTECDVYLLSPLLTFQDFINVRVWFPKVPFIYYVSTCREVKRLQFSALKLCLCREGGSKNLEMCFT